jgi:endonuclease YncB( thermonuclease family)
MTEEIEFHVKPITPKESGSCSLLVIGIILVLIFLPGNCAVSSERIEGRVIGVHDGDTLTMLVDGNKKIKIRLAQIDAPESSQAFGQKSKQALAKMTFGKDAVIIQETVDRYGRIVGDVFVSGENINEIQVKQGMAWVYRQYAHDKSLVYAEMLARNNRIGLWSESNPVPPWDFRRYSK